MVPYLRAANVVDGRLDLTDVKDMNFTPTEQPVYALRHGDVLVTEGSGSLRAVGASAVWSGELPGTVCFQNTLLRLRPRRDTDPRFLAWWCRSAFGSGIFASIATGANIYHLSAERVRALPLTYLAPARQRAIADFLDAETARIDALIAKRGLLQTRLRDRFETQIFSAVTHGLKDEPLVPSGISWVDEKPASWGSPTVSAKFAVQLGKMLDAGREAGPTSYPYLRNTNVQWDRMDLSDVAEMSFDPDERSRFRLRRGDLLVCEGGDVGRAAVWSGEVRECFFQKALHRVRPVASDSSRFLMYALRAAAKRGVFANEGNTSTIVHLTREQLLAHRFPWPDHREQEEIVGYLDAAARLTEIVDTRLAQQTQLLRERRQALITTAVTGELPIPGAAA